MYSGDSNSDGSKSKPVKQVVEQAEGVTGWARVASRRQRRVLTPVRIP